MREERAGVLEKKKKREAEAEKEKRDEQNKAEEEEKKKETPQDLTMKDWTGGQKRKEEGWLGQEKTSAAFDGWRRRGPPKKKKKKAARTHIWFCEGPSLSTALVLCPSSCSLPLFFEISLP